MPYKPTASFEQDESNFSRRVAELRSVLKACDPVELAEKTGAEYQPTGDRTGSFQLLLWERPIVVPFPELVVQAAHQGPASVMVQALLMYYFQTAHGPAPSGEWIAFSELPDGKFYNLAFQGYSGKQIARVFGNSTTSVQQAALNVGGQLLSPDQTEIGDFACLFQVLPRLPILLVGWQGDEDFPASYQLLFDATAANYLPTDVCAIVGGMLTRKIIAVHTTEV